MGNDSNKKSASTGNVLGASEIKENVLGGSAAGGVAGSGGVSTNSVGVSKTTKNPLKER